MKRNREIEKSESTVKHTNFINILFKTTMKKINLLAVALAAFTLFSCSNEEIADLGSNAPGRKGYSHH